MRRAHGQQPCAGEVTAATDVRLGDTHVGKELSLHERRMAEAFIPYQAALQETSIVDSMTGVMYQKAAVTLE